MHEADDPDAFVDLLDPDALTGQDGGDVDAFAVHANAPASGHQDLALVQGVKADSDGDLLPDVEIGSWTRPWNAKPDAGRLRKGIPPAPPWAYDPRGIEQVGCVYTAQGFEFDYVGVIWGPDLTYRFDQQGWIGDKTASRDSVVKRSGERFLGLVKNTYRVLLSRGLKGCYVVFLDRETENFVRSRMEIQRTSEFRKAGAKV